MSVEYPVPAKETRAEITVVNSRFIATLAPLASVEEARAFIKRVRAEFADASHNVPAYIIGHGSSVTAHCSDDGEPSGTAGRPALAVLKGSKLGDVGVVVTRYFGGTKLGTGGLVRAYSDAVRKVLAVAPRARKVVKVIGMVSLPYSWYERMLRLVESHAGELLDKDFGADVMLTLAFTDGALPAFQSALMEKSHGSIEFLEIRRQVGVVEV